jgi:DNA-binding NarL/FixJ family response regulator
MARILIFQGSTGHVLPLQNSLQDHHDLYFVHQMTEAIKLLYESKIDLIITNAYDNDTTDAFSFMQRVRKDRAFSDIPIVCLSKERSSLATHLDATVRKSALLCGADKYLSMDSFCGAKEYTTGCSTCPSRGELCDYAGLKGAVEEVITKHASSIMHACH